MAVLGEVQFAPISSAVADATLVAAQGAGVKIRVIGFCLVPALAAVVTLQSGIGGTALTGAMTLPALERRMGEWLAGDYRAVLFEDTGEAIGYALFHRDPDFVYLGPPQKSWSPS